MRYLVYVLVGIFVFFPIVTFADTITNANGVEMTEEEYNSFLLIHTPEYIDLMDEAKYNKLKNLDYTNIEKEEKYVVSIYNHSLNLVTHEELTEEEYEDFDIEDMVSPYLASNTAGMETTAKEMDMAIIGGTYWNYVTLDVNWKYIPSTRSFDVIGFRGYGFDFMNGSQEGEQIYKLNGSYSSIHYSWNGTNIKREDNGFGISMNIVNSDIRVLQLTAECDVHPTVTHPEIFGSYQHATNNVTLAQSHDYDITGTGLGGVFDFTYNIRQKYDGMAGLEIFY